MPLRWTEDLRVGNQEIDLQHQEIFKRFNEFLVGCEAGKPRENLDKLFGFLETYIAKHFAAEEELMRQGGYPQMETHLQQHQQFTDMVLKLKGSLEKKGVTVQILIHTTKSVAFWLTTHIREIDTSLARYLARQTQE